jgi:hypothetical protein
MHFWMKSLVAERIDLIVRSEALEDFVFAVTWCDR